MTDPAPGRGEEGVGRESDALAGAVGEIVAAVRGARERVRAGPRVEEVGVVASVAEGVAKVEGLPGLASEEVVRFTGGALGVVFNLDPEETGVILLDAAGTVEAGDEVRRTGREFGVPVGDGLLGRVVDGAGRPLDDAGPVASSQRRPAEREAPPLVRRAPVAEPLHTGVKAVDALVPVGRGQRELIIGDRQTGKTTLAVDTIINQRSSDVICVYCAVGQRKSSVADVVRRLRAAGMADRTLIVATSGEEPPGLQFLTPYAATAMAEHFVEAGRDVLVVFDDLTRHARAYRELALLLRRPPGREAYPGDIFYVHARLLERATKLRAEEGGGSLTALPVVETEAGDLAAYIPTNLISITDGQIYLSSALFRKGVLPAVDIGKSVSRVGGSAQLPAYQDVVGDLRLAYSQFLELEVFSRFAGQLDPETRQALERGRRVREVLKQPQGRPLPPAEQVAALLAVTGGVLDPVPVDRVAEAEEAIRREVRDELGGVCRRIERGEPLTEEDRRAVRRCARTAVETFTQPPEEGAAPDADAGRTAADASPGPAGRGPGGG